MYCFKVFTVSNTTIDSEWTQDITDWYEMSPKKPQPRVFTYSVHVGTGCHSRQIKSFHPMPARGDEIVHNVEATKPLNIYSNLC